MSTSRPTLARWKVRSNRRRPSSLARLDQSRHVPALWFMARHGSERRPRSRQIELTKMIALPKRGDGNRFASQSRLINWEMSLDWGTRS